MQASTAKVLRAPATHAAEATPSLAPYVEPLGARSYAAGQHLAVLTAMASQNINAQFDRSVPTTPPLEKVQPVKVDGAAALQRFTAEGVAVSEMSGKEMYAIMEHLKQGHDISGIENELLKVRPSSKGSLEAVVGILDADSPRHRRIQGVRGVQAPRSAPHSQWRRLWSRRLAASVVGAALALRNTPLASAADAPPLRQEGEADDVGERERLPGPFDDRDRLRASTSSSRRTRQPGASAAADSTSKGLRAKTER